ncbi:MAG: right-handed parallel beta-helix repeat-containing protein [Saprospiraceae bacterium]|nr:right-handed parallel beta-helix repeat-containing protein [Saprospiraceae bacterium]MCF8250875.1 right-handed parallel beta-helix repeat-containing protein [Saprospiraceae bacterium]MCF8281131.1 right-handed parallel beta-helix repeat-containing protein [Bacteroidales bacterium]MCF8312724.1 right-handed parallel beta-helix repeat-containing protein [Saprospiraceae bacterium]MCF8441171.1 right-handed parallel beta-helix repeat-containing protein [Saprospiraceae bacterium]
MKSIITLLLLSSSLFSNSKLYGQELTLCEIHGQDPINNYLVNSSSSQFLTNTLSNQVIYLPGTFTVNTSQFTFDNCVIKMASGAKILIDPAKKLTITNCKIFSCTDMWKEITVSASAKLQLPDSEIEDGQYAVHSSINAPILNITNNRFNRNHVSIYMSNKIPAQTSFNYNIYGNVFDCTSSLNSPYPTQSPVPAQISFVGIWLQGVPAISIGLNGAGLNEFINQMIGILSEGTFAVVTASTFKNISFNGLYEGYDTGIGISALNNSYLMEKGLGNQTSSSPTFDNCESLAIFSSSSVVRCFFNRIVILEVMA